MQRSVLSAIGSGASLKVVPVLFEEMVALAFMKAKPDVCFPIQSPDAVAQTGYYPARSCIRYAPGKDAYTVSIEDFMLRKASPLEPPRDTADSKP